MSTPEAPSDPAAQTLRLDDGVVEYLDEGPRDAVTTVVAIHGLPGSARDFRWLAPCLTGEARLVRLDLRGFGGTPARGGARLEHRAEFVWRFIDALGIKAPIVLGHSIGGPVATAVASLRPEATRGLALVASAGLSPHRGFIAFKPRRIRAILRVPGTRRFILPKVREAFIKFGFSRSTADEAFFQTVRYAAALCFKTHASNLRKLKVPTLVAWADDDILVDTHISEALSEAAPDGPRLRFETGGHNIQKTQAIEVGAALLAWADGL